MRLIDLVARTRDPYVVTHGSPPLFFRLRGAVDLAAQVVACPVRYILTDELTRACAELAYSCGDRLATCLDLLRVPAPALWVEWSDAEALRGAVGFFGAPALAEMSPGRRVGLYIQADSNGQLATVTAFWSESEAAIASPVEALIDLREETGGERLALPSRGAEWMTVTDPTPAVAKLLERVRFRFDTSWANYYDTTAPCGAHRLRIIHGALGGIARDIPLLMAFMLLLTSHEGIALRAINFETLNRKRARKGSRPLLDHLEASLAIQSTAWQADRPDAGYSGRAGPRHHHVRGHLVRRRNRVFWRRAHVRGNQFQGMVLSRTVTLRFGPSTKPS